MIRRGTANDVALLHELGARTFFDTFQNTCTKEDMRYVLDLFFNKAQCLSELSDPNDNFFFYEEAGIVKGYIRVNNKHTCPIPSINPKTAIELVRLYVLKEYHGTEVANSLMQFAQKFATENQFNTMYLSVWEYNFRARGFYQKHGFANSGIENDFPLGNTPQTDLWFFKHL